jgi:hypothetical protein
MIATFAAVTTLLTAAKSRAELIAAAQTIQHVGCINQRERLSRTFSRRYYGEFGRKHEQH